MGHISIMNPFRRALANQYIVKDEMWFLTTPKRSASALWHYPLQQRKSKVTKQNATKIFDNLNTVIWKRVFASPVSVYDPQLINYGAM